MTTVQQARDAFLARRGFTTESYDAPIVPIPIGPITIPLPSSEGRRALVRFHDLHHVLTGYDTDFVGEGEIGAWELRAGCTNLAGYVYNGMAVATGLLLAPHRVYRAWKRARGMTTLYRLAIDYGDALSLDLVELRARVGLPPKGAVG
jgi:hypothetical protein